MIKFVKKYYWEMFLFFITFISYGQMFWMGVWQDDNAIFFKLQHINEAAGFFGRGLVGEGPYRFSFTPYWFIYKIFGEQNTLPYYVLIFVFYFLVVLAIYKFFSKFISVSGGKIASFLFACGLIGSEGFFWLANAMVSDVSIILLCLCLYFYYIFSKKRNLKFYLLAIVFYWTSSYFTLIRSYYFIGIVILFELIFLASKKSILRLIPFAGIFYYFFVYGGDSRTGLLKDIIESFLSKKFYIVYGFFSTLSNIIFQDSITAKFFDWQASFIKTTSIGLPYVILITIFLSILGIYLLYRKRKNSKKIVSFLSTIILIWTIFSNAIFNVPIINLNDTSNYVAYLGGVIIIYLFAVIFVINSKVRGKYLFILLSFFLSITAYWAYQPLISLNTTHRYLTGTFAIFVGLLAFIFHYSNKKVKALIIFWGVLNLISSFNFQNQILNNRTFPVDNFYTTLRNYLPVIQKGDLLYFDLGDNKSQEYFQDAISTASMPNETSFAWRYGIDRYDFRIISNFNDFIKSIKLGNVSSDHLHSFYYAKGELIDTTNNMRELLENGSLLIKADFTTQDVNGNLQIDLKTPIVTLTPVRVNLNFSANLPDTSKINFPYVHDSSFKGNTVAINSDKRDEAFGYFNSKTNIIKNAKIISSSYWQTDVNTNLTDNNTQTNWRANRLLWGKEKTNLTLDLGKEYKIGEFVWINGFGNSTPTKYSLEISRDGINWKNVIIITNTKRIDGKDPQVINFDSQSIRYIRMNFIETLDGDSPQISEVWTVSSEFDDLNVKDTEEFLANPFGYVADLQSFESTFINLKNFGEISLNDLTENKAVYDGVNRNYTFTIPQGGITISQLVLKNLQIPGKLILKNISYKNLSFKEIER